MHDDIKSPRRQGVSLPHTLGGQERGIYPAGTPAQQIGA